MFLLEGTAPRDDADGCGETRAGADETTVCFSEVAVSLLFISLICLMIFFSFFYKIFTYSFDRDHK